MKESQTLKAQEVVAVITIMFGSINIILSMLGGICLSLKYETIPSMLGMPVFMWGIGGFFLLITSYILFHESQKKITIVMPIFFTFAVVYGTSAAMGISSGAGLSCPFCKMIWIINIFILTALLWELIYVRAPALFDQEDLVNFENSYSGRKL